MANAHVEVIDLLDTILHEDGIHYTQIYLCIDGTTRSETMVITPEEHAAWSSDYNPF